jgi:hypothetical protein
MAANLVSAVIGAGKALNKFALFPVALEELRNIGQEVESLLRLYYHKPKEVGSRLKAFLTNLYQELGL